MSPTVACADEWAQVNYARIHAYDKPLQSGFGPDELLLGGLGMVRSIGGRLIVEGLNVTEHAALRMAQREISLAEISTTIREGTRFGYQHEGIMKTGYYNANTNLFVGSAGQNITTVFRPATGQRYIDALIGK